MPLLDGVDLGLIIFFLKTKLKFTYSEMHRPYGHSSMSFGKCTLSPQSTYSTLPPKAPSAPSYPFPRRHRGFTLHVDGLHSVYSFVSGFFHELSSDFCFSTMPLLPLDTELPAFTDEGTGSQRE